MPKLNEIEQRELDQLRDGKIFDFITTKNPKFYLEPNSQDAIDKNELISKINDSYESIPERLYVDIEATHTGITLNDTEYTKKGLKDSAYTWLEPYAKPVLKHHNSCSGDAIGRVIKQEFKQSIIEPSKHTIQLRLEYLDKDSIKNVLNGATRTYSIGARAKSVICNICGTDILQDDYCGHWKGRVYEKEVGSDSKGKKQYEKVKCIWQIPVLDYKEISEVHTPADENAQIINIELPKDKHSDNTDSYDLTFAGIELDDNGEEIKDLDKEKWGKGNKIVIDNTKESVSKTSWSNVGKSSLRNKVLAASNYKSLVKEVYGIVEEGWEDSPSSKLKYPHHQIIGEKCVVNEGGVKAARSFAARGDTKSSSDLITHIKKHYNTLELQWDSNDNNTQDNTNDQSLIDNILNNKNNDATNRAKNNAGDEELVIQLKSKLDDALSQIGIIESERDDAISIKNNLEKQSEDMKVEINKLKDENEQTFKTNYKLANILKNNYIDSILVHKKMMYNLNDEESTKDELMLKTSSELKKIMDEAIESVRAKMATVNQPGSVTPNDIGDHGARGTFQDNIDNTNNKKATKIKTPTTNDVVVGIINCNKEEE